MLSIIISSKGLIKSWYRILIAILVDPNVELDRLIQAGSLEWIQGIKFRSAYEEYDILAEP